MRLLLESGDALLLEDGTGFLLEPAFVDGNVATETDIASAGTIAVTIPATIATETDVAQPGTATATVIIEANRAHETEHAHAGTVITAWIVYGNVATETDIANAGGSNLALADPNPHHAILDRLSAIILDSDRIVTVDRQSGHLLEIR